MIKKRKQFPFFSLPAPKFLTKHIKKIDDFVVLVRVKPEITIFNYVDSVLYPLLFICTLVSLLCVLAEMLLSRAGPLLLTFLEHYWWTLFISIFTGYTLPPPLQSYAAVFWFTFGCFIAMLWSAAQVRRTFREFRGLRRLHMMPQTERKEFLLDRFFRISLPAWLYPSVSYEPTPEELLKLLREREQATEQQTQDIAATLDDEEEEEQPQDIATILGEEQELEQAQVIAPILDETQELEQAQEDIATTLDEEEEEEQIQAEEQELEEDEQPSISMLLTLTHNASISLLAPGNRQATVELKGAVVPLVGFLATQARGSWITKEELFRQVYDPGKESAFAMHRKRATTQVILGAREAGIFPIKAKENTQQPSGTSAPPQHPLATEESGDATEMGVQAVSKGNATAEIELFKNQMQGLVSSWQLTSECNVEIFPFLTDFYRKAVMDQALPHLETPASLSLEQLRQGCHHVMKEYREGFLASHMKKGYVWSWALPLYKQYREQCLFILVYANQREREYLHLCQTSREKYPIVEHMAQLYGWQAMVAVGLDIKDGGISSEKDMEHCLGYYGKVKKKSAARATYQRYCELRSRFDPTYEPSEALNACAEEVLSSKGKADRSNKSDKEAS